VQAIGIFSTDPFRANGKAQRAGKRGAGFALFAKHATLLTVRLERFVRAFFALRLMFIFTPGLQRAQ